MKDGQTDIMRVAIVEDEPPMLRFLSRLLSHETGFQIVAECMNAEELLDILEESKIDLLISDIKMSGMGGLRLAEKIRNSFSEMHIVIVTGYKSFENAKAAIDLNIDAFITKPIDQKEFREVLARIRGDYLTKYYSETRTQLNKAFLYNDEDLFRKLLSGRDVIYGNAGMVCYPGDMEDLLKHVRHILENRLYISYKNVVIFFSKENETEELQRYIAVKFSNSSRCRSTLVCAPIFQGEKSVPTISQIKEFCRLQLLQILIPGKFSSYSVLSLNEKILETVRYCRDEALYREIEVSVLSLKWDQTWQKINEIFGLWEKDQVSIYCIRRRIRSIIAQCDKAKILKVDVWSLNDQVDEAIVGFDSYEEIKEYFISTMKACLNSDTSVSSKKECAIFEQIKALVFHNLDHNYTLQEICDIFQVSPPYVRKIFRTHTGKSYNDFILDEKIKYAVNIINANPQVQVKKLASMLGYEQLYFGTVFRKNMGITPSQYKQRLLESGEKQ